MPDRSDWSHTRGAPRRAQSPALQVHDRVERDAGEQLAQAVVADHQQRLLEAADPPAAAVQRAVRELQHAGDEQRIRATCRDSCVGVPAGSRNVCSSCGTTAGTRGTSERPARARGRVEARDEGGVRGGVAGAAPRASAGARRRQRVDVEARLPGEDRRVGARRDGRAGAACAASCSAVPADRSGDATSGHPIPPPGAMQRRSSEA